jgi:hypothetical protein
MKKQMKYFRFEFQWGCTTITRIFLILPCQTSWTRKTFNLLTGCPLHLCSCSVETSRYYQNAEGKENTGGMCWNSSLALGFVTPCRPRIISILRLPGVGIAEYPLENSKKGNHTKTGHQFSCAANSLCDFNPLPAFPSSYIP